MESFSQLLEEELENSFEVKNKKALHRSVLILADHVVTRKNHDIEYHTLRTELGEVKSDVKILAETMQKGFESIDKRFEDVSQRFRMMLTFLGIGFIVISFLMSVYEFIR